MDAQNEEVVKYCLALVDAKFIGETSNKVNTHLLDTFIKSLLSSHNALLKYWSLYMSINTCVGAVEKL